ALTLETRDSTASELEIFADLGDLERLAVRTKQKPDLVGEEACLASVGDAEPNSDEYLVGLEPFGQVTSRGERERIAAAVRFDIVLVVERCGAQHPVVVLREPRAERHASEMPSRAGLEQGLLGEHRVERFG